MALGAVIDSAATLVLRTLNLISGACYVTLGLVIDLLRPNHSLPLLAAREQGKATPAVPGEDHHLPARLFTLPGEVYIYRLPGLRTLNVYLIALWTLIVLGGARGCSDYGRLRH